MANHPDYIDQPEAADGNRRRTKPDKRWTILFIGDHGKVVTLKRFKSVVFFSGLIFILLLASMVLLIWYSQNLKVKSDKLQSSMDIWEKRVKELRHEKDILMARLVLAESRAKSSVSEKSENKEKIQVQSENQDLSARQLEAQQFEKKEKALASLPAPEPDVDAEPPDIKLSVDVEEFLAQHVSGQNKLKIQFKVKNTSPISKRVSGHTIVVLKNDDLGPEMWFSIPALGLVDGKPTGKQRGHRFSINHFRTMRFTANAPQTLAKYNTAAVYVFADDGEFLLEKNFPVEFAVHTPPLAQPSEADDVFKSLKGVGPQTSLEDEGSEDGEAETSNPATQGPSY
jgi:hypothetical protein